MDLNIDGLISFVCMDVVKVGECHVSPASLVFDIDFNGVRRSSHIHSPAPFQKMNAMDHVQ